jgi:hypothetical protein
VELKSNHNEKSKKEKIAPNNLNKMNKSNSQNPLFDKEEKKFASKSSRKSNANGVAGNNKVEHENDEKNIDIMINNNNENIKSIHNQKVSNNLDNTLNNKKVSKKSGGGCRCIIF